MPMLDTKKITVRTITLFPEDKEALSKLISDCLKNCATNTSHTDESRAHCLTEVVSFYISKLRFESEKD